MKKWPYITTMLFLAILYLSGQYFIHDSRFGEIVSMLLAIIAAVAFWMEFRNNERVNEAQLVMELNHQFISDEHLSDVEYVLEKYYSQYTEAKKHGKNCADINLDISFDYDDKSRQYLVNYLVHLEGIAALIDEGVIRLNAITDLMAYRYFIAVNNPIVQEKELLPCRDYYRGCFRIYEKWSKALGEDKIPMAEYNLLASYKEDY